MLIGPDPCDLRLKTAAVTVCIFLKCHFSVLFSLTLSVCFGYSASTPCDHQSVPMHFLAFRSQICLLIAFISL